MEKYATFSRCFVQIHLLSFETAENSSNQFTALKEKINRLAQHNSTRTTSRQKILLIMSLSFVMLIKFIFKKMCMKFILRVSGMKFFQPKYTDHIAFYLVAVLPRLTTFCVETALTLGNENSFRDFFAVCDTNYSFKSAYTLEP